MRNKRSVTNLNTIAPINLLAVTMPDSQPYRPEKEVIVKTERLTAKPYVPISHFAHLSDFTVFFGEQRSYYIRMIVLVLHTKFRYLRPQNPHLHRQLVLTFLRISLLPDIS